MSYHERDDPQRRGLGIVKHVPGEEPPPAEFLPRHNFITYLEEEYLKEYLTADRPEHYKEIPQIVTDLLVSILDPTKIVKAELTSGVPKCMVAGMPARFWEYPQYFERELRVYQDNSTWKEERQTLLGKEVVKTLEYLSHGPADLDLKINPANSERSLKKLLEATLVPAEETEDVGVGVVTRKQYCFERDEFNIIIQYGPIPTNPDREGAEIKIQNKENGETAFLIHPGVWPQEAQDAIEEGRMGDTSRKQDFCTVPVEVRGDQLIYQVPRQAREVMDQVDGIPELSLNIPPDEVSKKMGRFMDKAIRALRINLLHPLEDKVDFNHFFPLFNDKSRWNLRTVIQYFVAQGVSMPEHVKSNVRRELLLCLTIDPYLTARFLRDTGLTALIPGLADLTWTDWQEILNSNELTLTLGPLDRRSTPLSERGADYLAQQRQAYKETKFDGAERFFHALRAVKGISEEHSAWYGLLDLFEEKEEEEIKVETELVKDTYRSPDDFQSRVFRFGNVEIVISIPADEENMQKAQLLAVRKAEEILTGKPGIEEHTQRFIKSTGERPVEEIVEGHKINWGNVQSMIEALSRMKAGLTPRELKQLVSVDDFDWQFLYLKLNGFVERKVLLRTNQKGQVVPVEFYTLRKDPPKIDLNKLQKELGFVQTFMNTGRGGRGLIIRRSPKTYLFSFRRRAVWRNFLEIFQTLKEKDLEMINPKGVPRTEEGFRRLVQQFEDAVQEYSNP